MLTGFKDFILRGNVVGLAVAVVIGAAFTTVVTAFTSSVIQPLINAITPPSTRGFGVLLIAGKENTYIDLAALLAAVVNFLLVAAVVYLAIVYPLRALEERRRRGVEPGPADPTEVELLTEIRDLLRAGQQPGQD